MKRAIWRVIPAPSPDEIAGFTILHTYCGIPGDINYYSRVYFDPAVEEMYQKHCINGVVTWRQTNPWRDTEELIP